MAEAAISVIAGFVLERISSLVHEDISLLWGLQGELGKLEQTVSRIHAVLADAEEKRDLSHQDEWFVRELKEVFYDADDLLDLISFDAAAVAVDRRQETRMTFNALANRTGMFFSKPKYAFSLRKIRRRLYSIIKDMDIRIDPSQRRRPAALVNRETFSVEHEELVIGREEDAAAIKKLLLNSNADAESVSFVSIVGIGGLGKTTLARLVFNESQVKAQFEENIWVCVSDEFDVKAIFANIIESLTGRKPEISQIDALQQNLQRLISEKKYLLVLDDVWNDNEESWDILKAPLLSGAKKSKIIITTRSRRVVFAAGDSYTHDLEGLSEEDSWDFFRKTAFKESQEANNDDLIRIGKKVVKHCAGVPLAIKAMGRLLSNTRPVEWQQFEELSSVIQGGAGDRMFQILKLSYDHLQPNLKQCFAYCALFQKDQRIDRERLIRLWVAQGFIKSSEWNIALEDVGDQYFMHLLHMSFFQEAKHDLFGNIESIKMHDLMHDLATSIAKFECVLSDRHTRSKKEKVRHLSFNDISTMQMQLSSKLFEEKKHLPRFVELPSLKHIALWNSCALEELPPLHQLPNLQSLTVFGLNSIEYVQDKYNGQSYMTTFSSPPHSNSAVAMPDPPPLCSPSLKSLKLQYLPKLKGWWKQDKPSLSTITPPTRPYETMAAFISLQQLDIEYCPKLDSLPHWLSQLTSLQQLSIRGCPKLQERCRVNEGADWPYIAHIPCIDISN